MSNNVITLPVDYKKTPVHKRRLIREEYVRVQEGNCYYCKQPLDGMPNMKVRGKKVDRTLFPKGFFSHPVHLHHSHDTGMTIGAVHNHCNAVLWQYHGE